MSGAQEKDGKPHPGRQDVRVPWRIFCAFEIPAEVSSALANRVSQLRSAFPQVKASWNRDGKFHVTLKFIGDVPQPRVASITQAAARAADNFPGFDLAVGGPGAFPEKGPPRVLWIGIDDLEGRLGELFLRLDDECARQGFAREARGFHPHLTLARLRHPDGTRELARFHTETPFSPIRFRVSELLVIRSELSPQGSHYATVSQSLLSSR